MKKISLLLLVTLMMTSSAFAGKRKKTAYSRPYGAAGCGLGSVVMGKDGPQIFASTTNGSTYSQFLGITFGTLNCEVGAGDDVAKKLDQFIGANRIAFASDVAQGQGESLKALSAMMNCSSDVKLQKTLQSNFKTIFPRYDVPTNEVTDSIITVIGNDPELATTCKVMS